MLGFLPPAAITCLNSFATEEMHLQSKQEKSETSSVLPQEQDKEGVDSIYLICRLDRMIRTIRVNQKENHTRCHTLYTKLGVDRTVGTGIHVHSCQQFAQNIKKNLEDNSWKCRDITSLASISHSFQADMVKQDQSPHTEPDQN